MTVDADTARRVELAKGCQIMGDGRTLWINSRDGWCIARFSPTGIDIHAEPFKGDKHCLQCEAKWTNRDDWAAFVAWMRVLYGVDVSAHMPAFLRVEKSSP